MPAPFSRTPRPTTPSRRALRPRNTHRLALRPIALACLFACAGAPTAALACNAFDTASLQKCIKGANAPSTASDSIINITDDITLTEPIGMVLKNNVTIDGGAGRHTLDGDGAYRGFFVESGNVVIKNLTMTHLVAAGGAGASGGGGAMGAGAAVFVRGGTVTLENVSLLYNTAVGGNGSARNGSGGGGGMGGDGVAPVVRVDAQLGGGGGGLFVGQAPAGAGANGVDYQGGGGGAQEKDADLSGGPGGTGGFGAGGGGGSDTSQGSGAGGSGGFGGGGGASGSRSGIQTVPAVGGMGGFGGGGGSGRNGPGAGGFGGGNAIGSGGGGAGMGGAVFVVDGASLTIRGSLNLDGNTVSGGAGGDTFFHTNTGSPGSAYGSGIFLQGNGASLTFDAPADAPPQTVADVIADQTGSGGTGSNAGSIGITKNGAGVLVLSGNNTYSGTTKINAGTLQVGEGGTSGTIGGTIAGNVVNNAALVFKRSDNVAVANTISGNGSVTQAGPGTLELTGTNTYSGDTNINTGTLAAGNGQALGTGAVILSGGTLRGSNSFSLGNNLTITPDVTGTIAAADNTTLGLTGALNLGPNATAVFGQATGGNGTINATGAVVLNSSNSLRVAGGILNDTNGALSTATAAAGSTTVDTGAQLQYTGSGTIGNLQGGGTVSSGAGLTVGTGNFSGVIAGGPLSLNGTGTLVLSGANTYAGGTTIANGGTLQVGAGGASGNLGAGTVRNSGSLVFNRSDNITVDNIIDGSGSLAQTGTGTLTLTGAITGDGSVAQLGTGTTVLTGTNTYTGDTTIAAGTLAIDNNQALGEGPVILGGGTLRSLGTTSGSTNLGNSVLVPDGTTGTIVAANGTNLGLNGVLKAVGDHAAIVFGETGNTGTIKVSAYFPDISGSFETLRVAGGTLVDDVGALLYATAVAGTTTVDANARLQYDLGGVVRNLQGAGTVASVEGLWLGDGSFSGAIEGGPLAINRSLWGSGTGEVILSGNNTYTGGTSIASGNTLQIVGDTGTLGSGDVLNNGALVFNRSNEYTVGNAISGSGSLTQSGSDKLVLTGDNSYSGTTTITAGTLQVGAGGTTGSLGTGDVVVNDGGTLAFNRGDSITVANAITGEGSLRHDGPQTLVLTGNNNYGGTTTIAAGTLQVGAGRDTGSLGTGGISNYGVLAFNRSGTVTVTNDIAGAGSLQQIGTGTTVLTGNSSYSGGTRIAAGEIQMGSAQALGTGAVTLGGGQLTTTADMSITNDIRFAPGQTGTLAAATGTTLSVAGSVHATDVARFGTSNAAGTIALNGPLADASATTQIQVAAGTLSGSQLSSFTSAASSVTVDAGATLDYQGDGQLNALFGAGTVQARGTQLQVASGDFEGAITGSGKLVHSGAGNLVLSGNNTYTGGTDNQGLLQVGAGGTSGSLGTGNVTNNGTLVINRSDPFIVPNAIAGTGSLTQAGPGITVLTGDNTYTGGTTISAGMLQIGDGGASGSLGTGSVTNNAALAFNRSDTLTVANTITGTGGLIQGGAGNLVLTGANTYTGPTLVNAGTLSVNGSIAGSTTVNSGGTLGGSGTVGNVHIASGGTLAPGNSIGTLTANGNLSFAPGSTYRVEANAAGASDRVDTIGAGTITIDGGTVDVQAGGGGYQRNTRYTILNSAGGTTGSFDHATTNLAFLSPTLIYEGNAVLLNLEANDSLTYASVARTANQAAVATHLGSFANAPSNAMAAALIQQVDNFSAEQARQTFGSLAGTAHASASQVALAQGRNFSASLAARTDFSVGGLGNAMTDWSRTHYASVNPASFDPVITSDVEIAQAGPARGVETPLASAQERGLWVQTLGSGGRIDSDGNGDGSRYRSNGFVLGYDQPLDGRWLAGGAVGYSRSWWNATSGSPASGHLDSPQAGLYARYAGDAWRLRLDATYADHDFTTDRTVAIGAASSAANSSHRGKELGLATQLETSIPMGDWQLRPLAGLRYAHLNEDAFTETGAGAASLAVADRTTQNTLLAAGMRFVRPFNEGHGGLELRAIASHLAGDNDSPVTASIAGQAGSFTANGAPLKRNALTLGATVSGQFTNSISGYLDANYEYRGAGQDAHRVTAGVRVSF